MPRRGSLRSLSGGTAEPRRSKSFPDGRGRTSVELVRNVNIVDLFGYWAARPPQEVEIPRGDPLEWAGGMRYTSGDLAHVLAIRRTSGYRFHNPTDRAMGRDGLFLVVFVAHLVFDS